MHETKTIYTSPLLCMKWPFNESPALCLCEHVLVRLQVDVVSWRIGAQSSGSLSVSVAFWPVFLAVAGLAVDLGLVRRDRGAVQPLPAAHCVKEPQTFEAVIVGPR